MIQLQILNRVITDGNLNLLMDNNIDEEYFNQYIEEYSFIVEHYTKFGNTPDDETLLAYFPEFELLDVKESEKYLLDSIREEHLYNSVVPILSKCAELMSDSSYDAIDYVMPRLKQLVEKYGKSTGTNIMANTMDRYKSMVDRMGKNGLLGISSGLDELDEILGGWLPGEELVTIVGRVNQGKSWILLYFLAMAWQKGKKVLLYSGEMGSEQVAYRVDTLVEHVSNRAITRGTMSENDCNQYKAQLERMESFNIPFIVVTPKDLGGKRLTVPILESLIEKYNPDIIGIDQLSLMDDARNSKDVLRVQLTHIAEDLFRLSEKVGKPILCDAQANRKASDKEQPDTPELNEIGESDGIGQYSSRVISLVQAPSGLKLSIKKNRYGENNKSLIYCWDIDLGTFSYLPGREDDAPVSNSGVTPKNKKKSVRNELTEGSDVF